MLNQIIRILFIFLMMVTSAFASVNINTATVGELDGLPGIGPSKAAAIVAYRDVNGPFGSVSDLKNVKGIGDATLSNIAALCTIGDGTVADPATPTQEGEEVVNPNAININSATASILEGLPGIGPSKAAAIVGYREANGPFSNCNSLSSVHGIGSATVSKLISMCTTGNEE
jgi:competence protein ComEA